MRKKLAAALAVMVVASACLTACSKADTDAATAETATAETATGETAAIEYDLGLDDDGYFRNVTASKYVKMPKNYEKYTVSEDVYTVTDDAIQKELDAFQNNYNLTTEVTGRAAQNGDVVNIAYEGTVDGVAFTGGTSEDYSLQLGSGTFIDGFEDQIVGHNVGDSFDVTVTFPDGYGSTTDRTTGEQKIELSNKEAVFHVTLNKISEYSMTDADVTSIMSGKTLQDGTAITTTALLRDYVEENLRLNQVSSDVQQYFLDNMKVKKDITDLVDMNLQTNLNYVKQEAAAYDMDLETFVQTYSNYSSSEEYSESLRSDAEDGIKLSLAAQYLAEEQGFKKVSSPQERHDYVVYKMHEDILNQRYHESVQTVLAELKKVIPRIELTGQWSVDVMRNGNDYYIIDMALAENSALNDCVPKNLLRAYPQQWLPGESNS